jgi:hypothetical protein
VHISAFLFIFIAYALGQVSPPEPQAHPVQPGMPMAAQVTPRHPSIPRSLQSKPRRQQRHDPAASTLESSVNTEQWNVVVVAYIQHMQTNRQTQEAAKNCFKATWTENK